MFKSMVRNPMPDMEMTIPTGNNTMTYPTRGMAGPLIIAKNGAAPMQIVPNMKYGMYSYFSFHNRSLIKPARMIPTALATPNDNTTRVDCSTVMPPGAFGPISCTRKS